MRIEDMPAGPTMDEMVADVVMGWHAVTVAPGMSVWADADGEHVGYWVFDRPRRSMHSVWAPSQDIAAAWQVVEELRYRFQWGMHTWIDGLQYVDLIDPASNDSWANADDSMPLAICRVALRACGVTEVPD